MTPANAVRNFCMIQLQLLQDKELRLRKEILDCKIQREFLSKTLKELTIGDGDDEA